MQIWTHRGNPGPENTLEAFALAWADGIRYFETDIHSTLDGVLVLAHDSNIVRLTGIDREISSLTWNELQETRVEGTTSWSTLRELYTQFPEATISIDIKSPDALAPFLRWAKGRDLSNVVVGSFSSSRVSKVRGALPGVRTALTPVEVFIISLGLGRLLHLKPNMHMAMIPIKFKGLRILNRHLSDFCAQNSIPIIVWTINSKDEIGHLESSWISGVVTDNYYEFL